MNDPVATRTAPAFRPSLLLLIAAGLLLWRLNYATFWNPDEGRYASSALEMAGLAKGQPADWVVPHLNSIPRLNKPPLLYWLAAGSYQIFGPSEWSGRLISALAAIGVGLLIWRLGRRMFSEKAGVLGALIWATSTLPFGMARVLNTDMLLCATITLGLYGIWKSIEEDGKQRGAWLPAVVAGVGMGLALLAKGPVGMALPLGIGFVYLCATRRWNRVPWSGFVLALVLAVVIALPWYWAVSQRVPGFLKTFIFAENLGRFSGKEKYHSPSPFWYYIPIVIAGLFPWTPFLPLAFRSARDEADADKRRARLFLWLWASLLIGFFSLSSTKLASYVLPAMPALALLVGEALSRLEQRRMSLRGVAWWLAAVLLALLDLAFTVLLMRAALLLHAGNAIAMAANSKLLLRLLPVVLLLNLPGLLFVWRQRAWRDVLAIAPALTILLNIGVVVGAWVALSNNKIVPRGEARPFIAAIGVVLLLGTVLMLGLWRAGRMWHWTLAQFATACALFGMILPLAGRIATYEDASVMVQAAAPFLPSGRLTMFQVFQPTAIFYLRQPLPIVDFKNNSGLDEAAIARSPLFSRDDAKFWREFQSAQPLAALVPARGNPIPPGTRFFLWARDNDHLLIANRPKPRDLNFDFTAPLKRKP